MKDLIINVYDENDKVVKTSEAKMIDLKFGPIRSLMKLLDIDDIEDTATLLKTVYGAWEQLTGILSKCFPDMEDEDWDNVKINELLPTIIAIIRMSFNEMLSIPSDSKN